MAFDAFLILKAKPATNPPAFKSETNDKTFSKYISMELQAFSGGFENPMNTSGGGGGKVKFSELVITVPRSNNVVGFMTMCTRGMPFERLTIYLRKAGGPVSGGSALFAAFTFGNAFVTGVATDASSGDDMPTCRVTFAYQQLAEHGTIQNQDGTFRQDLVWAWDQGKNTKWDDNPLDGPGLNGNAP